MDTVTILELSDFLFKRRYSKIACGIEVTIDYNGMIPYVYEALELQACDMLYFQNLPYENEDDYSIMIGLVNDAISNLTVNYMFLRLETILRRNLILGHRKKLVQDIQYLLKNLLSNTYMCNKNKQQD